MRNVTTELIFILVTGGLAALVGVGALVAVLRGWGAPTAIPGSAPVSPAEELRRVLPVIEAIRRESPAPLSIDTRHEEVARAALGAGVVLVNDVSALRHDPTMAATVAEASFTVWFVTPPGICEACTR